MTGKAKFLAQGLFSIYLLEGDKPIVVKLITNQEIAQSEFFSLQYFFERGILVPKPYGYWEVSGKWVLAMEFISSGACSKEKSFLESLTKLYSIQSKKWGWEINNFIGSLPQPNIQTEDFFEYFWKTRFLPQLNLAVKKNLLKESYKTRLELLLKKAETWGIHKIQPRLIHGDLWSGNIIWSNRGMYLIDLSPAYGHPEQDLGMANLFGGFPTSQMPKLLETIGLDPYGYLERISFWQVYPLLVHVNLFGSSYLAQLENCIRKYDK